MSRVMESLRHGPCKVIAEVGNNHGGSVSVAHEMIESASDCGVWGVKFQRRDVERIYTGTLLAQPYDNPASFGAVYGAHRKALELPLEVYTGLSNHAHERGLTFGCTAFDERSADEVVAFCDWLKVASGDVVNLPLLRHLNGLGRPVLVSTGGVGMSAVYAADKCLTDVPAVFLHCTASYPASFDELNLRAIDSMMDDLPHRMIGWSSHDNGIAMGVAAAMLGARVIEKHFTLNRASKGTDHAFSLEPTGLRKLVRDLNRLEDALGDGIKRRYASEDGPLSKMQKAIVAAAPLSPGLVLRREHLALKSPAGPLTGADVDTLIGRVLRRSVDTDEALRREDVDG